MSAFSPYPQRYLSLGYEGGQPRKCTSSNLAGAIKALWHQNGIGPAAAKAGPEATRSLLREEVTRAGRPYGLWGKLPDGRWLSLDPEEAQDALRSGDQLAAYEAALKAPPDRPGALVYQLRATGPDQQEITKDASTVRAALTAFAEANGFPFAIGPNFTFALSLSSVKNKDIALCARLPGSIAAVPIPLKRAQAALASNHAEFQLAGELHREFTLESDWALPDG